MGISGGESGSIYSVLHSYLACFCKSSLFLIVVFMFLMSPCEILRISSSSDTLSSVDVCAKNYTHHSVQVRNEAWCGSCARCVMWSCKRQCALLLRLECLGHVHDMVKDVKKNLISGATCASQWGWNYWNGGNQKEWMAKSLEAKLELMQSQSSLDYALTKQLDVSRVTNTVWLCPVFISYPGCFAREMDTVNIKLF